MASIVVVDDDNGIRELFRQLLERAGHKVLASRTIQGLYSIMEENNVEVVLLDVHLPDGRGDQILSELISRDPHLHVIIITGDLSVETAVSATRNGAFDYLTKPFTADTLQHVVNQALSSRKTMISRVASERTAPRIPASKRLVGSSPEICEVNLLIDRIAATPSTPVLITGESGTGKEMVAQTIHEMSARQDQPLIKVNCSAIPRSLIEAELFGHERGAFTDAKITRKGLFELADGGTIFLDEIGELDILVQPKLLRILEDRTITRIGGEKPRQVDIRVVAATNRDLQKMVARKEFREDLYFRLAVMTLHMPPLREHPEDIERLANLFLQEKCMELGKKVSGFSEEVLAFFRDYRWPGNVRELKNMVERLIILTDSDKIQADHDALQRYCFQYPDLTESSQGASAQVVPRAKLASPASQEINKATTEVDRGEEILSLEEMEKRYLRVVIRQLNFNKTHCAQKLGISRSTLQRKLAAYGLDEWVDSSRGDGGQRSDDGEDE